jgi:GT2 family glycosyltransferase
MEKLAALASTDLLAGPNTKIANLTVAIATLNRPTALARAVQALLDGELAPAEILIIDQGDAQQTEQVLSHCEREQVIIRHQLQTKRGLAAARNLSFDLATYPIVAVTDDDCVADAKWVKALIQEFSAEEPPDAVTGRVLPLGPEVPGHYAVSSRTSTQQVDYQGKHIPWLVGTGANFAVKHEWVARVGYYSELLGAGTAGLAGEDIDLQYRLLRAGASIRYQPDAVIYHERQSQSRRTASRFGYGHGVGAFCALLLRRGDRYALNIFWQWLMLRNHLLLAALRNGRWSAMVDEGRVLWGTAQGLHYGFSEKE